jgi:DNA-3-methyladenine glycosylase II
MANLINKYEKPNFTKETNHFEAIIRSIIYQQLSTKAASAIHNRFKQLFENDNLRPVDVFNNSIDRYREIGLSKQKASYIINVAHEFNNELIPKNLEDFSDEDIIDMLTRIKGIGRWTAQMFLMFSLNRSDILPELDLGIQKGFKIYFKLNELPSGDYIIKQAELWRPYRTLASWYLWRLVEGPFEW